MPLVAGHRNMGQLTMAAMHSGRYSREVVPIQRPSFLAQSSSAVHAGTKQVRA